MRHEKAFTVEREGRDRGGVFRLEEMAALPATDWFIRAVQLLARSGADIPPHIMAHGPEAFAAMGLGTILEGVSRGQWGELKPLLDELLACVKEYTPPGAAAPVRIYSQIIGQIQEPSTIFMLYEEVLSLHLGFSVAAGLSKFGATVAAMIAEIGQNTGTSTSGPESSSPQDLRH